MRKGDFTGKYAWHQDHKFNFDEVKIIDRSDNYKKRIIL